VATKVSSTKMANTKMAEPKSKKSELKMSAPVDLPGSERKALIALLNQLLADTFDLVSQTKQAHWNVKGPQFMQLHLFYDTLYEGIEVYVDEIAERITSLDGVAVGTARSAAAASRLPEMPIGPLNSLESVDLLLTRYKALANSVRAAIDESDKLGDAATADLFTQMVRDLDKWSWFLQAHLEG
jgi:starvation-inducible DNA-binding protein